MQSMGPNVQLASTSLQGQPVRRWRRGHALAGVPMGNSWLRRPIDGDVSASGCGEPIPPSTLDDLHADAEHRRAPRAVTPMPLAVVVRLHPSALFHWGM